MALLNSRTKLISFRLSEEEYNALTETWSDSGAPSLSEYARGLLFESLAGKQAGAPPEVNFLRSRLAQLTQLIELIHKETSRRV